MTSLYDTTRHELDALAAMLSLPTDQLEAAGKAGTAGTAGTVRPCGRWLADQAQLSAQLPARLRRPGSGPRSWAVQASQLAKRVALGVAGGGTAVAEAAAAEGVRLDAKLRPRGVPTVLCAAHRRMHPTVVRELFHFLAREVADRADPVRRHGRGGRPGQDGSCEFAMCRSAAVRDWGNRMLGVSALWTDARTFSRLHGWAAGAPQTKAKGGRTSKTKKTAAADVPRRIEADQQMGHLELPCEVCVLAAVAAQSQLLVDLQASMLSRMALEAYGRQREHEHSEAKKARKDRKDEKDKKDTKDRGRKKDDVGAKNPLMPKYYPHLWRVVESWITAFEPAEAEEIRRRAQDLAKELYVVRRCECRRRRLADQKRLGRCCRYLHSRYQSGGGGGGGGNCPGRMATRHGHRLPLPLLPQRVDAWVLVEEPVGAEGAAQEKAATEPLRAARVYTTGGSLAGFRTGVQMRGEPEAGSDRDNDDEHLPVANPVEPGEWEEAYRRDVLESETMLEGYDGFPGVQDHSGDDDDHSSYVTITIHTELDEQGNVGAWSGGPCTPCTPCTPIGEVVTPPPTPLPSPPASVYLRAHSRETASAGRTSTAEGPASRRSTRTGTSGPPSVCSTALKATPPARPPSALPRPPSTLSRPPSSVYPSTTCPTRPPTRPPTRQANHSRPRLPARTYRPPPLTRPPRATTPSRAPSTTFRPPPGVRKPATASVYEALQEGVAASFGMGPVQEEAEAAGSGAPTDVYCPDDETVVPDDSISCVMERRDREWQARRERRREREERRAMGERAERVSERTTSTWWPSFR